MLTDAECKNATCPPDKTRERLACSGGLNMDKPLNGWTPERKLKQAEAIRRWQPWAKSTGPKSSDGKAKVSRNSWKGGQRQQLRGLIRLVNADVRASRELLATC